MAEVVFLGLRFASWAEIVFVLALAAPVAFFAYCALYLWRLLLAALPARSQVAIHALPTGSTVHAAESRVVASPPAAVEKTGQARFILLIPAHNEELLLGEILDALHGLDYPRTAYRILVIADNCSDRTAEIARAHEALVLERFDNEKIGKGYALEWALQALLGATDAAHDDLRAAADFDAVVILDADTKVAPDLLTRFASGLAAGHKVMQARYDVLNAEESWRSRLMTCALALVHLVKPLGREQLKLSDGLKGNGMCFAREVVEQVPWSGASITEDIEYTLRLCRAGYRVAFLPGATVWAQMPTTGAQATTQRQRWEGGRYRLLFSIAPGLLWEGVRKQDRILQDRAIELIVPPFAEMFAGPVALLGLCVITAWGFGWQWAAGFAWACGVILALQVGYLLGGLWVARVPKTVAMALLGAPLYIVWKFGVYAVMAVRGSGSGWQRTERRRL